MESRLDELLNKAVEGKLTREEALELKRMIKSKEKISISDDRFEKLIIFGVGAAMGYTINELLKDDDEREEKKK